MCENNTVPEKGEGEEKWILQTPEIDHEKMAAELKKRREESKALEKESQKWIDENCPVARKDLSGLWGEMRSPFSAVFNNKETYEFSSSYLCAKSVEFDDPDFAQARGIIFKLLFKGYVKNTSFIENKESVMNWFEGLDDNDKIYFMNAILFGCRPEKNIPKTQKRVAETLSE